MKKIYVNEESKRVKNGDDVVKYMSMFLSSDYNYQIEIKFKWRR